MAQIKLVPDGFAIVDDEDIALIADSKWYRSTLGYAISVRYTDGVRSTVLMHRILLGAVKGESVDHVNHDPLDNRRSNLRLCTHADNMKNRVTHQNNKLGVKGVYFDPRRNSYRAQLRCDGKKINLGSFQNVADASAAYARAAQQYHGEFACLG